ncbi:MAG: MFS transporter [Sphingomonas sp.]|uniref:MFS transporter n=1 Tax=Sphingomonas sp. TaxID=28214 RepID=UPI0025EB88E6|nr:MFS transporter [Sphingomonas sp.]MBX3564164.1 MFS transporter [Sphingomonas sp.]
MSEGSKSEWQSLPEAVTERLDSTTSWKVRYWIPIALGLMMMGDSWDLTVAGFVMPSLRAEWGMSAGQVGMIFSAGFAGQMIGAILFGPLAERFGRMPVFNIAIVVMSLLSIACGLVHDPLLFATLRFLQGVGFGGAAPVIASYINEMAPTASRGRYFSTFQFLMISGFSLCAIASALVIPTLGWRMMFFIGAFPVLLTPFVLWTLPESPRWLARMGRLEETNRALVKLGAPPIEAGTVDLRPTAQPPRAPLRALFAPGIRMLTLCTCVLWFCTALVSKSFATWTPTLYVDVFGLTVPQSLNIAAWIGVVYGCTPIVFAFILDRVGRRPTGIAIASATLITTLLLSFLGNNGAMLSIFLIGMCWVTSGSSFTLLWPYTAEVFPTHVRSTALGMASAVARAASSLTPLAVAGMLSFTGSVSGVFLALALSTLVVLLLWLFTTKEMARRSLDQLDTATA